MKEDFEEILSHYGVRQYVGWVLVVVVVSIALLLPFPEAMGHKAWFTAMIGLVMAILWMTEAIPIPITALLPLVLFPLFRVEGIKEVAAPYANPLIFLFMGGFIIALAMEKTGLHRRIALNLIYLIGTKPKRIVFGFLFVTAVVSMWVSNTATALMMLPIATSVIALAEEQTGVDSKSGFPNFATALVLSIAYGASVGGIGTLIGTPPNAFMAGFLSEAYNIELGFAEWMMFGLPLVFISLPLVFVLLALVAYPIRLKEIPGGKEAIKNEIIKLGKISTAESMVLGVFTLTAVLWITRPFLKEYIPNVSDASIAMLGAILLFVLATSFDNLKKGKFIMDWETARKLPWEILLLFGGGLSLAHAVKSSKLAEFIAGSTAFMENWPIILVVFLVTIVVIFLTELTSNTATAAAFLPLLGPVAVTMHQAPLMLVVPAAVAASCAFMLPVATPPNAIVFGSGKVTIPQMAYGGVLINLMFVVLITALTAVLLPLVFNV